MIGVLFRVRCRNLSVRCWVKCWWMEFECLVLYLVSGVGICVFGVGFSVGCRNLSGT